jgi:hypothetical protein
MIDLWRSEFQLLKSMEKSDVCLSEREQRAHKILYVPYYLSAVCVATNVATATEVSWKDFHARELDNFKQ